MDASRACDSSEREVNNLQAQLPHDSTLRTIQIPVPGMTLDFRICVQLEPRVSLGRGVCGQKNWIGFRGGHWSATWGHGTVKAGGQDIQIVTDELATRVDTNYLLQTLDSPPVFLTVKTQGWRTGKREVLEKLFDPTLADGVDPSEYFFRLYIIMECGHGRYAFLNNCMWIGSGARRGAEVLYDAYRIS